MPVLIAPVRGHLQKHFRRWSQRWSTVAADSFRRIDSLGLGPADSGHDWLERSNPSGTRWEIRGGHARSPDDSGTGTDFWAYVALSSADVRIRARMLVNGIGTRGPGIFYRAYDDGSKGWHLLYDGLGNYDHIKFDGTTWTTVSTFTSAAVALGTHITLEVRTLGSTHECWVNDLKLGSFTDTTYSAYTRHGFYNNSYNLFASNEFAAWRCVRNA